MSKKSPKVPEIQCTFRLPDGRVFPCEEISVNATVANLDGRKDIAVDVLSDGGVLVTVGRGFMFLPSSALHRVTATLKQE